MNAGKTLFAKIMDFLPWTTFTQYVERYDGDHGVRTMTCAEQYPVRKIWKLGSSFHIQFSYARCYSNVHSHRPLPAEHILFRLPLPIATALGSSCIVWSVLGVAVFQGVMPPINALLGMLIYAAGMCALIAVSKKEVKVAKNSSSV